MSISRQNQKATYSKSTLLHISLKKREKSAQGKQVLCSQISVMHCSIRIFQNWEISVMAAAFCAWCWENHGDWYHCCRFSDLSHNDCCDELIMLLDIAIFKKKEKIIIMWNVTIMTRPVVIWMTRTWIFHPGRIQATLLVISSTWSYGMGGPLSE